MKSYAFVLCLLLTASLAGCGHTPKSKPAGAPAFRHVEIPAVLQTKEEQRDYMVSHYWDNFDFKDTSYIHVPQVTEQALADYLQLLSVTPPEKAKKSITQMLARAQADSSMFAYFTGLFEKYLHDPNSPYRNEELYIPVLEYIVNAPGIDPVYKIRPQSQLETAMKNRPGTKAADFSYMLSSGKTGTLYGIKAEYVLIYLNNPGCHACEEARNQMLESPVITNLVNSGRLKILAVYPDEDITAWKKEIPNIPPAWINSYDHTLSMRRNGLYDLTAIPAFYLLDRNKTVLLKDPTLNALEQYLVNLQ